MSDVGQNVTDFISTRWMSEADGVLAEVTSESNEDSARYCQITLGGGGRSQVRASLEAFDASGNRTGLVEAW
jgi:hypothetical protein